MIVEEFYSKIAGDWKGSYSLWLDPTAPTQDSAVEARVRPVARGVFHLRSLCPDPTDFSWRPTTSHPMGRRAWLSGRN